MLKQYAIEKQGQEEFFQKFGISCDTALVDYTDGIRKGCIFEFKLSIGDINKVLFQAIKYLSKERIKGHNVPASILLIDLNGEIAYKYNSADFLAEIEKVYNGAASKNNAGFQTTIQGEKIDYSNPKGIGEITRVLEDEKYTKIHIDLFCVIGWAERFYKEFPKRTKKDLFVELCKPFYFKKFIYPWEGEEINFKYIMDCLNDRMHKKELGAFYTPPAYCKKAVELVRRAIAQIPAEHDYIILDRCAGTGNLEEFLTDKNVDDITLGELKKYFRDEFVIDYIRSKRNVFPLIEYDNINNITIKKLETYKTEINIHDYLFDNELSHCVVNTYELKEWLVLYKRIGDKVKMIIPPYEDVKEDSSLVNGGDALSEHFITGRRTAPDFQKFDLSGEYYKSIAELNGYIKDPNINVIMFENPPYRNDIAGNDKNNGEVKKMATKSFVFQNMVKVANTFSNSNISTIKDISNRFIWSAWNYYLQKENDCYVLLSPVKYWKSLGLSNKKFIDGFLLNRKYFHATESSISCVLWKNEFEDIEKITLHIYDLYNENIKYLSDIKINKVHKTFEIYFDRRNFEDDIECVTYCENDGTQTSGRKCDGKSYWNENILGYLVVKGFAISPQDVFLLRETRYNIRGFYLRSDNFIEKLPLFCAKLYPQKNWYERDVYFTTADGGDKYTKDGVFLKACFIFTCLSQRNHCLSFTGSDGRFYKNELCFDKDTLASKTLRDFELTEEEDNLIKAFSAVLKEAQKTANYNPAFSYGTYQIEKELNTSHKDPTGKINIYDYPELNTAVNALKSKLSLYYEKAIQSKLFEYELLK